MEYPANPPRFMWELLLQLRELLPYLTSLAPLLDRALKAKPELDKLSQGIGALQAASRDLEVQARNQALQLERIEQQLARLRVLHEGTAEENRKLLANVHSLRRWVLALFVMLLVAVAAVVAFLVIRS
jgi:hypothetical protein